MQGALILLSGGVDSSTLLAYLAKSLGPAPLYAISFDYGQKHSRELGCARWQARSWSVAEHRVVKLAALGQLVAGASALTDARLAIPKLAQLGAAARAQPATYVPNRNLILLALAAAHAESLGISTVFYGAQPQDGYGYWDCTPEFIERLNALWALNRRRPIELQAPFIHKGKSEIIALGHELGVDYAQTWSCYRGLAKACGTCPACQDRRQAFERLDMLDPISYENC